MTIQRTAFQHRPQHGWATLTGSPSRYEPVFVSPNFTIVSYDDATHDEDDMEVVFGGDGGAGDDPSSQFVHDALSSPPARAPRDWLVVTVTGSGDVHPSTECERIDVDDDLTRTLPSVYASGAELRDGHRVRFLDPFGSLGGALPTHTLTVTTNDSALIRTGGTTGTSIATSTTGASVELELVKGPSSDGSDSVWVLVGDGGGLL